MRKYKFLFIIQAILIFMSMFAGCTDEKSDRQYDASGKRTPNVTESITDLPQSTIRIEENNPIDTDAPLTTIESPQMSTTVPVTMYNTTSFV